MCLTVQDGCKVHPDLGNRAADDMFEALSCQCYSSAPKFLKSHTSDSLCKREFGDRHSSANCRARRALFLRSWLRTVAQDHSAAGVALLPIFRLIAEGYGVHEHSHTRFFTQRRSTWLLPPAVDRMKDLSSIASSRAQLYYQSHNTTYQYLCRMTVISRSWAALISPAAAQSYRQPTSNSYLRQLLG